MAPSVCPNCGRPVNPGDAVCFHCRTVLDVFTAGARVAGRYIIEAPVGQGGMGRVYRAFDETLQERVAIKTLLPEFARDPAFVSRFRDEVRLARKISHSNVCRVHDYVDHEGTPFLSMEWVEGETMAARLQRLGPRPEDELKSVFNQAAQALRVMWSNGIVHRDLKPANLMWTPDGRLKLMDMGLARAVRAEQARDKTSGVIGSPDYLSPEQIRGENATEDSDTYALGTTLFELASGRPPFRGETPAQTLARHLSEEPDPRSLAHLSEELRSFILKALSKNPKDRPNLRKVTGTSTALIDRRSADVASSSPFWTSTRMTFAVAASALLGVFVLWVMPMFRGEERLSPQATPTPTVTPTALNPAPTESPSPAAPNLPRETPRPPGVESTPTSVTPRPLPAATPSPIALATATPPPPEPSPSAAPTFTPAAATPTPAPLPTPTPDAKLTVIVSPWADVYVNGERKGQTPLAAISLPPGSYVIELRHPDYRPYSRTVRLGAGEGQRLMIDLRTDGIRK